MDLYILLPGGILGLTLLGALGYAWRRSAGAGRGGQSRAQSAADALEVVAPPAATVVVAVLLAVGLFTLGVYVFLGSLSNGDVGWFYIAMGLGILAGLVLLGGVGIGVYWAAKRIRQA